MKVFLSWSGNLSRRVAETLREWLPNVLQAIEPWMSAEDIDKGARWSADVASELSNTKAGILCVTPDNREAPWLNFEAGALSKTLDKTFVSPYLIGLKPSDLRGPLVQFQATESSKSDTRKLMGTLNKALGEAALSDKQLDKTFEVWWMELESSLQKIQSAAEESPSPQRSTREMLEEILGLVRDQAKRSNLDVVSDFGQFRVVDPARLTTKWRDFYTLANDVVLIPKTGGVVLGEAKIPRTTKPDESDDEPKGEPQTPSVQKKKDA